jgi:hypothetical protein
VTLSADYSNNLQCWLDSQPRPRPQWAPEAPVLDWAGQVGEVIQSHKSTYSGLTLYHVCFSETKHLDGWYLSRELKMVPPRLPDKAKRASETDDPDERNRKQSKNSTDDQLDELLRASDNRGSEEFHGGVRA